MFAVEDETPRAGDPSVPLPDDEQLRTLLEVVPQQIFVLRPDFTIEYANKAILDYHGGALAGALFSSASCSSSIRRAGCGAHPSR